MSAGGGSFDTSFGGSPYTEGGFDHKDWDGKKPKLISDVALMVFVVLGLTLLTYGKGNDRAIAAGRFFVGAVFVLVLGNQFLSDEKRSDVMWAGGTGIIAIVTGLMAVFLAPKIEVSTV